jgi:YD repeat-containing protein
LAAFAPPALADAPKGAARRWEAALPVGKYGQVNLRTGRVLTTIPITGWSGRGPSIQFNLYHNQNSPWGSPGLVQGDLNGDEVIDEADIDPFVDLALQSEWGDEELKLADFNEDGRIDQADLSSLIGAIEDPPTEPDWRHSYSSKLVIQADGDVLLIRDDGTEDLFTQNAGGNPVTYTYSAPPGVWDTLTADTATDPASDGFTLTSRHQWKARYRKWFGAASGDERQLDWIADASAGLDTSGLPINRVRCNYDASPGSSSYKKLIGIEDATGQARRLELCYRAQFGQAQCGLDYCGGHLVSIGDVANRRRWKLLYGDGLTPPTQCSVGGLMAIQLVRVNDEDPNTHQPVQRQIDLWYNANWDIEEISDWYDANGPVGSTGDPRRYSLYYWQGRLTQIFDPHSNLYGTQRQDLLYFGSVQQVTYYVDRRGLFWETWFNANGNAYMTSDPLGHENRVEYGTGPLIHDVISVFNALNKRWDIAYDGRGNVLTVTDPLSHLTTFEYDGLSNLTKVIPPGNTEKQVTIEYGDGLLPTSPTKIVEPAVAPGQTPAETVLEYFTTIPGDQFAFKAYGKLKKVTPPYTLNPVVTEYGYDQWGQFFTWREGPPSELLLDLTVTPVSGDTAHRADGTIEKSCTGGLCTSNIEYDDDLNVIDIDCDETYANLQVNCQAPPNCLPGTGPCPTLGECPNPPCVRLLYLGCLRSARTGCASGIVRNPNGEITHLTRCAEDPITDAATTERRFDLAHDQLGRLREFEIESNEATANGGAGPEFTRTTLYNPNWTTGHYTRTGPDGTTTEAWLDEAGRVDSFVRKDAAGNQFMSATMDYDAADRLTLAGYGNGMETAYQYDDANRLTRIEHRLAGAGAVFWRLRNFGRPTAWWTISLTIPPRTTSWCRA